MISERERQNRDSNDNYTHGAGRKALHIQTVREALKDEKG